MTRPMFFSPGRNEAGHGHADSPSDVHRAQTTKTKAADKPNVVV